MGGPSKPLFKPYSLVSYLPSSRFSAQEPVQPAPDDLEVRFADDFAKAEHWNSFESFLSNLSGEQSYEILEEGGALSAAVDAFSPWSFGEMEALRGNEPSYFAKKFLEKRDKANNSEKLKEVENAYQAAYKKYLIKDILSHSKSGSPKYEVLSKYAKEELLIGKKPWQFWKMTPEKSARFWTELPLDLVFCFLGGLAGKEVGSSVTAALTKALGPTLAKALEFVAETGIFSHSVGFMDGVKNLFMWHDTSYFQTLRDNPKEWAKADLNSWAMAGVGIGAFKYSGLAYYSGIGQYMPKRKFLNLIGSSVVAAPTATMATGYTSKLLGHEQTAEQNSESLLSNAVFSVGLGSVEFVRPAENIKHKKITIPKSNRSPQYVYSGLGGLPKSLLETIEAMTGEESVEKPAAGETAAPQSKVTLGMDKVTVDGKTIKLKPIVDDIHSKLRSAPADVSAMMGIPFIPKDPEVKILDTEGFKKAMEEDGSKILENRIRKIHGIAIGKEEILIRLDYAEKPQRRILSDYKGVNTQRYEWAIANDILGRAWHELAHLAHKVYDDRLFTEEKIVNIGREIWKEEGSFFEKIKKFEKRMKEEGITIHGMRRRTTLIEGIATWVSVKLLQAMHVRNAAKGREISGDPELIIKVIFVSSLAGRYSLGYWFVDKVSNLIDANPIKLIIDHPPETYRELFNPEKYVERLKKKQLY